MVEEKEKIKIKIKTSKTAKDILDRYDVNDLLTCAIPKDHRIIDAYVDVYIRATKFDTPIIIELNDEAKSQLKTISSNYPNFKQNEFLSYLIEVVCNVSKINTKNINHALNSYYTLFGKASRHSSNPNHDMFQKLFQKLLNAYSDSEFSWKVIEVEDEHTHKIKKEFVDKRIGYRVYSYVFNYFFRR